MSDEIEVEGAVAETVAEPAVETGAVDEGVANDAPTGETGETAEEPVE